MHTYISKKQEGFTLVELAITLTIIGLLIAGVLKGQELLAETRVKISITQIRAFQAAHITFKDVYSGAIPGDMKNATSRITNCVTSLNACRNGDGNGIIGTGIHWGNSVNRSLTAENTQYWKHMALANLITGIDTGVKVTLADPFGKTLPASKVNGGFWARSAEDYLTPAQKRVYAHMSGNLILWRADPNATGSQLTGTTVSPMVAWRIDQKMDDGYAWNGAVEALSGESWSGGKTNGCNRSIIVATKPTGYDKKKTDLACDMAFKLD
ncbi:type II secretion system protein [Chryseobacterium gambrini]|uniref:type II secretion system protein n=1 Tax=Chryseobacterium gambrini TaxID=373672 RepID=UPI003D10C40C